MICFRRGSRVDGNDDGVRGVKAATHRIGSCFIDRVHNNTDAQQVITAADATERRHDDDEVCDHPENDANPAAIRPLHGRTSPRHSPLLMSGTSVDSAVQTALGSRARPVLNSRQALGRKTRRRRLRIRQVGLGRIPTRNTSSLTPLEIRRSSTNERSGRGQGLHLSTNRLRHVST